MTDWVLTKGLQHLRNQVNYFFPDRSTASDGTIGDLAHMEGISGHDPDDVPNSHAEYNDHDGISEVRAWDMTNVLAPGFDCQVFVDHLRSLPDLSSVIRYMIYNRRMYHERDGFRPTPYTGASPHTEHVHFSGAWTQAADNDTTFDYHLEEIPVALTQDDKNWLAAQIDAAVDKLANYPTEVDPDVPAGAPGKLPKQPWHQVDGYGSMERKQIRKAVGDLSARVNALAPPAKA